MDSLSSQWLDALGLEMHAGQLASAGFVTLEKCAVVTWDDLRRMGITDDLEFHSLLQEAERLRGRSEDEVVRELPVSVVHPEPIVMFSQS